MNSQGYKVEIVKDSDAIISFFQRTLFIEGPVSKVLGLYDSGSCPELEDFCRKVLLDALLVAAVDVAGNIVGVVASRLEPLTKDSVQVPIREAENCKNEKFKKMLYIKSKREEGLKIWEKYPEEKQMFDVKYASTDPAWRNKGIMKVLLERTEQIVRQKHIRLLRMCTTNVFSAYCAERNGFTCVYSAMFEDFKMNGEPLVVPEAPHNETRIYIKDLLR